MIEAIKDFLFVQLKPNELEERFRAESLSQDKTQTIIVMTIVLITIAEFLGLDISSLQVNAIHPFWIPSRIAALIASLVSIWIIRRQSSFETFDRVTFTWVMVVIIHMLLINLTRPRDYVPVIVWDILTISGFFL